MPNDQCPYCQAELAFGRNYKCGSLRRDDQTVNRSATCRATIAERRIAAAVAILRRHEHPAVTTTCQKLAGLVLKELGE